MEQLSHETISWEAREYAHRKKSTDWFWGVGVLALALAISSIIFNNVLFAVFILVAATALMIHAVRVPRLLIFTLNSRCIAMGAEKHPYTSFRSFWINEENEYGTKLILQSKKLLSPYFIIPLNEEIPRDEIREFLLQFLPEETHHEPAYYKLAEQLGF